MTISTKDMKPTGYPSTRGLLGLTNPSVVHEIDSDHFLMFSVGGCDPEKFCTPSDGWPIFERDPAWNIVYRKPDSGKVIFIASPPLPGEGCKSVTMSAYGIQVTIFESGYGLIRKDKQDNPQDGEDGEG